MSTAEQKRLKRAADKAAQAVEQQEARRARNTVSARHEHGQGQVGDPILDGRAPAMHGTSAKSAKTVVVACKLPHGIRMRLQRFIEMPEAMSGGGTKMVQRSQFFGDEIVVKGFSQPVGHRPDYRIIGDYALTPGVDKEFVEKWLEQNADLPAVKNKLIYVHHEEASVASFAKENEKRMSGLEPLEHDGDPRATRPTHSQLTKVAPDQQRMDSRKRG